MKRDRSTHILVAYPTVTGLVAGFWWRATRVVLLASLCFLGLRGKADYSVALLSDGHPSRMVRTGEAFDLAIVLTSDVADHHDSAVVRLVLSSSGLVLQDYAWSEPYRSGGEDDASVPGLKALPIAVTPTTVAGTALPADAVDLYWSNLIATSVDFAAGPLLNLRLLVPEGYVGPDRITISVGECTLADGAELVATTTRAALFHLTITSPVGSVPSPLAVDRDGSQLILSWPATLTNAILETSDDATSSNWVRVPQEPRVLNHRHVVTYALEPADRFGFFRLRFQ